MRRVIAYLQLSRPLNVVIAAGSVLVGALASGLLRPDLPVLLACLVAGLITGGANAINDVFDVQIDRVNKPGRPLPSGRLTRSQATAFSVMLMVLGVAISPALGLWGLLIAILVVLLLVAYSAWLKRMPLWGNLAVALAAGLAFLYGGIATGRPGPALVPACFAFLFHLGREILKDAQDEVGDRAAGARTLPAVVGVPAALRWAGLVFSILIAATPIPHLAGHYSLAYLIIVVFGVDFPLLYVIFSSQRNSSPDHLGRLSLLLKVDMWVGLAAILAGVWV
ncbi:geranylgeranylglycerol-phosphate geranylgeranyltransferase [bacterium]|nr:geranylgeranylglycerol-phosphate geranylgeranyltransferase [bacterium]